MAAQLTKHDAFCWDCNGGDITIECINCIRSFHDKCLKPKKLIDKAKWRCVVCTELDSTKSVKDGERLDILSMMINRVFEEEEFDSLKNPLKYASQSKVESMVNLMDLTKIKNKIDAYTSFKDLLTDIQWIIHNCSVLFSERHDTVKTAKQLKEYIEAEIKSVNKCAECYMNANEYPNSWFSMVCAKPHIVLWAKVEGWNYWPVKMMSIKGGIVNVRFFGEHTEADVPVIKCFFFSEAYPALKPPKKSKGYTLAMEEADVYIKKISENFDSYHVFKKKTPYSRKLLNHFFSDLIQGIVKSQDLGNTSIDTTDSSIDYMDLTGLNQPILSQAGNSSKLNEKLNPKIGPTKKTVRFADNNEEFIISFDGSIIEAATGADEVSNTPIHQSIANDAEHARDTLDMAKWRDIAMNSTKNLTKAFEYVCDLNTKMQNQMNMMTDKYDREIKLLEDRNKQLADKLKKKIAQLETKNSDYNKMIEEKDGQMANAVIEAKKQCEEEYKRLLEANKKKIFCAACDATKTADTFYFCNPCQQRLSKMQMKK